MDLSVKQMQRNTVQYDHGAESNYARHEETLHVTTSNYVGTATKHTETIIKGQGE